MSNIIVSHSYGKTPFQQGVYYNKHILIKPLQCVNTTLNPLPRKLNEHYLSGGYMWKPFGIHLVSPN